MGTRIIPVEVKAENRISGRSLSEYSRKFSPEYRIRYSFRNLQYNDGLLSCPSPLAGWTRNTTTVFSAVPPLWQDGPGSCWNYAAEKCHVRSIKNHYISRTKRTSQTDRKMDIKDNILGTIGNTPMVRINRLNPNPAVNIFAKLEGFNPTGSIKDRIALKMIEDAEADGRLKPGQTIIEPTSGNTGIGLAIVGIIKGYSVEIVMSDAVSVERRKIIRSYGATVTLTPGNEGTDGAIRLARKKVAENPGKYFMPDQFKNAANYLTHYQSTALEIWQQTGGKIDYLVCALGTSGTIMGLSKFLKVMNPHIKVVCAHPVRGHYIQGLKNMEEAIVPAIYDPSQIDIQEMIESEEAITMARRIIAEEAIFAGMSSGAAMLAAARTARRISSGNIVVVFPDRAEKYLSTGMFAEIGTY